MGHRDTGSPGTGTPFLPAASTAAHCKTESRQLKKTSGEEMAPFCFARALRWALRCGAGAGAPPQELRPRVPHGAKCTVWHCPHTPESLWLLLAATSGGEVICEMLPMRTRVTTQLVMLRWQLWRTRPTAPTAAWRAKVFFNLSLKKAKHKTCSCLFCLACERKPCAPSTSPQMSKLPAFKENTSMHFCTGLWDWGQERGKQQFW